MVFTTLSVHSQVTLGVIFLVTASAVGKPWDHTPVGNNPTIVAQAKSNTNLDSIPLKESRTNVNAGRHGVSVGTRQSKSTQLVKTKEGYIDRHKAPAALALKILTSK